MVHTQPHITVDGRAVISAAPDQVTLSFQMVESALDYGKCMQGLANRVHQLRSDLKEGGLDLLELRTGQFGIQPRYEYHEGKQSFQGYEARQHLSLPMKVDKDMLSMVLGILSRSESQAEFQLHFGLANPAPQHADALAKAVAQARTDAKILAVAAGVSLGNLQQIRYGDDPVHAGGGLQVRMSAMKEDAPIEVDPADVRVEAKITATWSIVPL